MAVRQYIGARYVPLFSDPIEWSASTSYEPLTVVTYQGGSYVSRQYVPAGIPLNNTNYWLLWADYNAQLEAYRQEVLQFDGRITDNADAIESISNIIPASDFSAANTISDALAALNTTVADKSFAANNVAALASIEVTADAPAFVAGYYAAGDGGAGIWRASDKPINGIDVVATLNGTAEYTPNAMVNAAALGVIGDAVSDIDTRIAKAFEIANSSGLDVIFPCAFSFEQTIHVTTQAVFCKRIQYNGTSYGMSYEAGSMKSLTFNVLACPNGGGFIMEQNGNNTITNVDVRFNRIYAASGIGMYLHSTTHGIMECRFTGDLVRSVNHALQIKCEDGYNETNAPFFGQNIFDVVRFQSVNNYAVDMQVGDTWSTITGVLFEPTSFEGSANGVRFYTGAGERAQLKGVHFAEIRTFEQLSGYMLNMAGGKMWANSLNFSTPVQIDKININASLLTDNTYIPTKLTGGILSPTQFMFATEMHIINKGIVAYKTDNYFSLKTNSDWTFGEDTAHYRILNEVYHDQGRTVNIHAGFLNRYGINKIIVNQNKDNGSTIKLYDDADDLIFDGTAVSDAGRTAYLIELSTGLVIDINKKVVSITKLGYSSRTAS